MNGLSPETSEKPYPSSPDQNLFTPPHSGQDAAREISSSERRQYNKALKAMYEIVRLGSKRLEKPVTDGDHDDDDDDDDDDMIPETVTETSETEEDLSGLLFYFYSFALLIGLKYLILFDAPFDSLPKTSVSPRSLPLGTFRAEERLRLRDRNSILMTQINVYLINPVVVGFQM